MILNRIYRSSRRAAEGRPSPDARLSEEGYILAAVIIMLAVLMIFLAVAAPKVRKDIQRDQELEAMQRGKQYIRAVQLYYRKFRHYPPNVDALEDTNMQRFLRKRYLDPLTGKDDWTPVLLGANKAPLTMGYFGQPLTMGAAVLTGSSTATPGGNNIVGASPLPGSSGFTSAFGSSGNGLAASPGMPIGSGAGIMGFSPGVDKDSILIYKTKSHYTEWEFVYDPATDRGGGVFFQPVPTGPPTNTGAPGFGSPTGGFGSPAPAPTTP